LPTVRVPSSTSNLGAGFDCLGLALDIWLHARLVDGDGPPDYAGTLAGFDPNDDFVLTALGESIPAGFHLEVHSDIPVSRGLGSSAAAIVAGLSLARILSHGWVDRDVVFALTTKQEGHPDNAGPAVYGGLVLHAGFPKQLRFHEELGVAIAVPALTISTHTARGILPEHMSREDTISQASRSAALLLGLTQGDGDLIGYGMVDHIAVPARRSLIKGYDDAVQAGADAGAYGVTISGAGSTLVAVCRRDITRDVADAIAEALTARGNPAHGLSPDIVETGLEVLDGEG